MILSWKILTPPNSLKFQKIKKIIVSSQWFWFIWKGWAQNDLPPTTQDVFEKVRLVGLKVELINKKFSILSFSDFLICNISLLNRLFKFFSLASVCFHYSKHYLWFKTSTLSARAVFGVKAPISQSLTRLSTEQKLGFGDRDLALAPDFSWNKF